MEVKAKLLLRRFRSFRGSAFCGSMELSLQWSGQFNLADLVHALKDNTNAKVMEHPKMHNVASLITHPVNSHFSYQWISHLSLQENIY